MRLLAHEINQLSVARSPMPTQCCLDRSSPISKALGCGFKDNSGCKQGSGDHRPSQAAFSKGATKERLDVNEVIREMEILLHTEAARHSVSVHTKLAADLPLIAGDRVQLQQVLMNLMINSIDAMKAVDGLRQLTLGTQNDNGEQFLVWVADTGIGLPITAGQISTLSLMT